MMNIAPDVADNLSLWQYEALLWNWNEAHGGGGDDVDPPDPKVAMAILDRINSNPALTH